jgi:L-2-hydroxyglutarate oxidase
MTAQVNIAVIGGGIVGLATAMALTARPGLSVLILEAEDRLAAHQTGHNSGVIHSGLYYKPGSLKARNCVEGRQAMLRFCETHGIAHERCGKLVVATREAELPALNELERRGRANGLAGLRRLSREEIEDYEPCAAGIAGLLVAETGIVDYRQVAEAYAAIVQRAGGQVWTGARVVGFRRTPASFVLETTRGAVECRSLINCAGLHSDCAASIPACGLSPFAASITGSSPSANRSCKT